MSGLHKTMRKIKPKEGLHMQVSRKVDESMADAYSSMTPKVPKQEEEKAIPLPDEEELERQRRRKGRGGGRASTVLTSNDEGLGG